MGVNKATSHDVLLHLQHRARMVAEELRGRLAHEPGTSALATAALADPVLMTPERAFARAAMLHGGNFPKLGGCLNRGRASPRALPVRCARTTAARRPRRIGSDALEGWLAA